MVEDVENIIRSIEDEYVLYLSSPVISCNRSFDANRLISLSAHRKTAVEERVKTRDVFARIEGLEREKVRSLPLPSNLLSPCF
jgi:hypothetical protein